MTTAGSAMGDFRGNRRGRGGRWFLGTRSGLGNGAGTLSDRSGTLTAAVAVGETGGGGGEGPGGKTAMRSAGRGRRPARCLRPGPGAARPCCTCTLGGRWPQLASIASSPCLRSWASPPPPSPDRPRPGRTVALEAFSAGPLLPAIAAAAAGASIPAGTTGLPSRSSGRMPSRSKVSRRWSSPVRPVGREQFPRQTLPPL